MARKALTEEEKLRRNQKQLGLTWAELKIEINKNGGALDRRVLVRGTGMGVRVIVRVRAPRFYKWAMAIVFEPRGRIDGIDWEGTVEDHRGKAHNCSGWHRHMWKPASLDRHKECLQNFKPGDVKEFIFAGFKVLNVQLKRGAPSNGSGILPFD